MPETPPSIVIHIDNEITPETIEKLREAWRAAYELEKHQPPRVLTDDWSSESLPDAAINPAFTDWYAQRLRDNLGDDDDLSWLRSAFDAGAATERARLRALLTNRFCDAEDCDFRPVADLLDGETTP